MESSMSCCGADCGGCALKGGECAGCASCQGKVFWLQYVDAQVCPIYECCAVQKGKPHCGGCAQLPCERYGRYKDPNQSEEQAAAALQKCLAALRSKT